MKRFLIAAVAIATVFVYPAAFAQVKISELPAATALTGAEEIPAVQGGVTTRALASQVSTYINTQLTNAGLFTVNGAWTFGAGATTLVPSVRLNSNTPVFELQKADAAADAKRWLFAADTANVLQIKTCNDGGNSCGTFISATRSGASVPSMSIGHTNATVTTHIGQSLFTAPGTLSNAAVALSSSLPVFELSNTSAAGNNRRYVESVGTNGVKSFAICQDGSTTCNSYMAVQRSGSSVTNLAFYTNNSNERLAIDTNGAWTVGGGAGTAGQVLTSNGPSASPSWADAGGGTTLANGTFTPTCTPQTGTSACTGTDGHYIRVGNQVSFTARFNGTSSAAETSVFLTIPITSAFTAVTNASGVCNAIGTTNQNFGTLQANASASTLNVRIRANDSTSITYHCSGIYTILP